MPQDELTLAQLEGVVVREGELSIQSDSGVETHIFWIGVSCKLNLKYAIVS